MLGLCDRWKLPPSVVAGEDASVLQMVAIQRLGTPPPADPGGPIAGGLPGGWQ